MMINHVAHAYVAPNHGVQSWQVVRKSSVHHWSCAGHRKSFGVGECVFLHRGLRRGVATVEHEIICRNVTVRVLES